MPTNTGTGGFRDGRRTLAELLIQEGDICVPERDCASRGDESGPARSTSGKLKHVKVHAKGADTPGHIHGTHGKHRQTQTKCNEDWKEIDTCKYETGGIFKLSACPPTACLLPILSNCLSTTISIHRHSNNFHCLTNVCQTLCPQGSYGCATNFLL